MAVSDNSRVSIVMEHLFVSGAFERDSTGIPMARTRAWMILDALDSLADRRAIEAAEAVRGGDAAPPAGTVAVRVAVALDKDGNDVAVTKIHAGENEALVWADMAECGYPQRSCTATIHAPLPAVPEVGAVVEDISPSP